MRFHPFPAFLLAAGVLTAGLALIPADCPGRDHVLTIGGGYSPSGNQVSLERNVVFFRKLLDEQLAPGTPHDVLFADGDSPNPDLQFQPADGQVPEANVLAAALFGSTRDIELQYRDHDLADVLGVSSPEMLEGWFRDTGATLASGDRLILYITAHGGKSSTKDNPHNTKLYMWNGQSIDAARLATWIAGLPEGVEVVTVMVQCYSGGFSHILFENADAGKADTPRRICGFYSTVHDRMAAGCTPAINEEDYDEYSSHFWAALRGKTRMDQDVPAPDYDGDGRVSFDEAHAYTIIVSDNIDVPIKTSDAFLRKHAALASEDAPHLMGIDGSFFQLAELARPAELAVLDGLSARLGLTGIHRGADARTKADDIAKRRKELADQEKAKKGQHDGLRNKIKQDLVNRWPALSNTFSPGALDLIHGTPDTFVEAVHQHPKFDEWKQLGKERSTIQKERFELDKQWALHMRLVRTLENIALEANLRQTAGTDVTARYDALLAAESGTLRPAPAPEPAQPDAPVQAESAPIEGGEGAPAAVGAEPAPAAAPGNEAS